MATPDTVGGHGSEAMTCPQAWVGKGAPYETAVRLATRVALHSVRALVAHVFHFHAKVKRKLCGSGVQPARMEEF